MVPKQEENTFYHFRTNTLGEQAKVLRRFSTTGLLLPNVNIYYFIAIKHISDIFELLKIDCYYTRILGLAYLLLRKRDRMLLNVIA